MKSYVATNACSWMVLATTMWEEISDPKLGNGYQTEREICKRIRLKYERMAEVYDKKFPVRLTQLPKS